MSKTLMISPDDLEKGVITCYNCNGTGIVDSWWREQGKRTRIQEECPACQGKRYVTIAEHMDGPWRGDPLNAQWVAVPAEVDWAGDKKLLLPDDWEVQFVTAENPPRVTRLGVPPMRSAPGEAYNPDDYDSPSTPDDIPF